MSHPDPRKEYFSHDEERAHAHRKDRSFDKRIKDTLPEHFAIARSMKKKEAKHKAIEKKSGKKKEDYFKTDFYARANNGRMSSHHDHYLSRLAEDY